MLRWTTCEMATSGRMRYRDCISAGTATEEDKSLLDSRCLSSAAGAATGALAEEDAGSPVAGSAVSISSAGCSASSSRLSFSLDVV